MNEAQREEVARILEQIAAEGMPHPRNLDAALDAIASIIPLRVLVSGPDHSYRWANLQHQKVCVSDYGRGFVYEYHGDEYVEDGFHVEEHWVAE